MKRDEYIEKLNVLYEKALKLEQIGFALEILERVRIAEGAITIPDTLNEKNNA